MPGRTLPGRSRACFPWRAAGIRILVTESPAVMSAFASVHSALHSTAFTVVQDLFLLFVAVFWLGLAYWVHRDAHRRMEDPWLVGTATALGLVPFAGPVVYLLFRPPETLEEVHARQVELHALEVRLARREEHCPVCRIEVEPSFLVCPVCTTQLKQPCARCQSPLDPLWQACPYCALPVSAASAQALEPADLDAALAAEATANGNGKPATRARKRSRAGGTDVPAA